MLKACLMRLQQLGSSSSARCAFTAPGSSMAGRGVCSLRSAGAGRAAVAAAASDFRQQVVATGHGVVVVAHAAAPQRLLVLRELLPAAQQHAHVRRRMVSTSAAAQDAQSPEGQTEVYTVSPGEYSTEYGNYHCITGTMRDKTVLEQDGQFWLTFVVEVVPASGVVDEYHCYLGGPTGVPHGAVDLARVAADTLADGDMVQPAGAMMLNTETGPRLYVHSLGKITPLPPGEQVRTVETPALPSHIAARVFGLRTPSAGAGAGGSAWGGFGSSAGGGSGGGGGGGGSGGASAAASVPPLNPPGMPAQASSEREAAWISLFQENGKWLDQRATKQGKQPDFRWRARPPPNAPDPRPVDALWIEDSRTPAWVRDALHLLPGGGAQAAHAGGAAAAGPPPGPRPYSPPPRPYSPSGAGAGGVMLALPAASQLPDFIPPSALESPSAMVRNWVLLFCNPDAFWDNRLSKPGPRSPDFKLKDREANVALWLHERSPQWVHDNLYRLPPPPRRDG